VSSIDDGRWARAKRLRGSTEVKIYEIMIRFDAGRLRMKERWLVVRRRR